MRLVSEPVIVSKTIRPVSILWQSTLAEKMLRRASEKARNYNGRIELRREDVHRLSFRSETFDAVFTSLVFYTVTDPIRGLREIRRVLKKDGKLLMLEHVRSKNGTLGYIMDRISLFIFKYGIDNINRDTVENLRKAGFKMVQDKNLAYDVVKAIVAVKQSVQQGINTSTRTF